MNNNYNFVENKENRPLAFMIIKGRYKVQVNFSFSEKTPDSVLVFDENMNLLKLFSVYTDIESYDHSVEIIDYAKTLFLNQDLFNEISNDPDSKFNYLF